MFTAKLISTCLGIGYIQKGAGTVAALCCCIAWYFLQARGVAAWITGVVIILLLVAGTWSASMVEKEWGKDSNKVVMDEWIGMSISLFLLPVNWGYMVAAFVLFRFFDIAKPLYIRKAESLPSGWGVMADDILAGIYSNIVLQIAVITGF